MRKHFTLLSLVAVLIGLGAAATLPAVAVAPNHPLYDTKTTVEEQVEELAPNETAEVRAKLEHAGKRANETSVMADENETELANDTANAYAEEMQEINDLGERVSDLAQEQKIDELVAIATTHHAEVLGKVYERVPEEAKSAISRAINASVKGHNRAVDAMEQRGQSTEAVGNITAAIPKHVRDEVGTPHRGGRNASNSAGENGSQQGQGNGNQNASNGQGGQ